MRFIKESRPLVAFVLAAVAAAIVVVFLIGDRLRTPAGGDQVAAVEPDQTQQTTEAGKADASAPAGGDDGSAGGTAATPEDKSQQTDEQPGSTETTEEPATPKAPTFDIVRVEDDGAAVIAGQAAPGAEIMLTLNGKTIGTAIANQRGEWVVTPERPLPPGDHDLVIVSRNADGSVNTSDQVVSVAVPEAGGEQPLIVLSQKDQPSKVLQKPEGAGETEVAASDAAADAKQTEAGTQEQETVVSSEPPSTAALVMEAVDYNDQGDILFSGSAGPGETVRVYVDNVHVGDAIADASGRWVFRGKSEIQPGVHTLRIDQVRKDGKVAQRRELPFERAEPARVVELHNQQKQAAQASSGQTGEAVSSGDETTASTSSASGEAAVAANDTAASASASSSLEPLKLTGKVVIQPGNNLWNISRVIYGRGVRYSVIYEANKDQIRNPHRIYPGQIFTTPGIVPPTEIDPKRRDPLEYAHEPEQQ